MPHSNAPFIARQASDRPPIDEATYHVLFKGLDEGVAICDVVRGDEGKMVEYYVLDANEAVQNHIGRAPEEIVGKLRSEFIPVRDEVSLNVVAQAVDTGKPAKLEHYSKGLGRWLSVWIFPLGGERFALLFRDVTDRRRAEEALRQSEERFRALVETDAQAVWETDAAGVVVKDSISWRDYTGQTLEERLGYGWLNAVHPDDREDVERQWQGCIAAGGDVEIEFRLRRQSGRYRWTRVRAAPIRDERGRIVKWVGMNQDIEERKLAEQHLRESEEKFRILSNTVPALIWYNNTEGENVYVNQYLLDFTGCAAENVKGGGWHKLIHPDDFTGFFQDFMAAVREERAFHFRGRIRRHDGAYRWIENRATPLFGPDGSYLGHVGVGIDNTDVIEAEEMLKRNEAELKRSNAELQQFAYVASHDLREPLRMVSSYLSLLWKRYEGRVLDAKAQEYIDFAVEGACRMQRMIDDLLAYSRIGTQGKALRPVVMNDILATVLKDLGTAIEESGASITSDPLPCIMADNTQMVLLLNNLLGNAIKFRRNEPPKIHIGVTKKGGEWQFFVKDNGIGIDSAQGERIFQMFVRLHTQDEYEGTGLGLAVAKKIVERHGGRIWVVSEKGEGSTFFFTIPL